MLLRDAQEQVRILYAARHNSQKKGVDVFLLHLNAAKVIIDKLKQSKNRNQALTNPDRDAGLLLISALALMNELQIA